MATHPLLPVLIAAAEGRFPPADGVVEILPPDEAGTWAVVELTGHAFILGEVDDSTLTEAGADGFGGAAHPDVQRLLAGPHGWIGCHDAVLVGQPDQLSVTPLAVRADLDDHPRVIRARQHRGDVTVYGNDDGLVVVGRGLAGRTELAVELFAASPGSSRRGRSLIRAALAALPADDWCFAQVSPGNAASLRSFLAAGFTPIGAEVLIQPQRQMTR